MPSPSLKILKELAPEIEGEIDISIAARTAYSYAACIYRILPLAVVKPRNSTDVAKVIKYAAERRVPVTARGGGSGVAGHSVGAGIILDFSCHMNRITAHSDNWVEVEPGAVLDTLNKFLAPFGKKFAPDPSSGKYCTIGGMIANNSSGAKGIKYGSTRRHVIDLEIVTADGEVTWVESSPWKAVKSAQLSSVLENNKKEIESAAPKVTKNSCGYDLWSAIQSGGVDINQLIIGSEGTLAVVTKAKLKLTAVPRFSRSILLYFNNLREAVSAVPLLRETSPSAIEVMDAGFLKLVRTFGAEFKELIPSQESCLLLIEVEADGEEELREKTTRVEEAGRRCGASQTITAKDDAEADKLWRIRKSGSPIISSMRGTKRPLRFVEDVIVPPENLADFTGEFMEILGKYHCEAPVIGHAGDGNLHVNPILDLSGKSLQSTIKKVADEVYSLVDRYRGSLSAEHGVGRLRSPYLERHYGKKIYDIFVAVKYTFDPKGILNPSVIIGNGDITDNLRFDVRTRKFFQAFSLDLMEPLNRCHGCGECKEYCPSYEVFRSEEFSPRGRVNITRAVVDGPLNIESAKNDEKLAQVLSLCLGCGRCHTACSSEVFVPLLVSHLKGKIILKGAKKYRDGLLTDSRKGMFTISKLRSMISPVSREHIEFIKPDSGFNKLFYRFFALNANKPLPIPQGLNLKSIARFFVQDKGEEVVYYPGCFATFIDPVGTGESLLFVLKSMGYRTIIPDFGCCGMPFFAAGDINRAYNALVGVTTQLAKTYPSTIITSCPSCARMLKGEILEIQQAEQLQERVETAETFIAKIISGKIMPPRPPMFTPLEMSVLAQKPCHQAAGDMENMIKILRKIPALQVTALPDICCGMGGVTGLKKENREFSAEVSAQLTDELRKAHEEVMVSVCGACRVSLAPFCTSYHPLLLIARAMGFKGN